MKTAARYGNALVLGLGSSGAAAAGLLLREGTRVTVADAASEAAQRERAAALSAAGAEVMLGCASVPGGAFDVCVASPGIPADSDWIRQVGSRGIKVIAELELGWSRCACGVLAVTGSNGKSTLVRLCRESLEAGGRRAEEGGNCGEPLSAIAERSASLDWLVAEASSFQLELVSEFRPDVGVLLNLNPNHLDRHGDMERYGRLKGRLFAKMLGDDVGVIPSNVAPEAIGAGGAGKHGWLRFGAESGCDSAFASGKVTLAASFRGAAGGEDVSFAGTHFDNEVMGVTAAAAVAAVAACGVAPECVAAAARSFRPLAHRMETIAEEGGVKFIDDSKATNLAATAAALRMCGRPARLIAGGRLKESDVSSVKDLLARKAKKVYLIGEAKKVLAFAWGNAIECVECDDLAEATRRAWEDARLGEAVLLSPACSSFDQFGSFRERGDRFKSVVKRLVEERKGAGRK